MKARRTEFRIQGDIPAWLLGELRKRYGNKSVRIEREGSGSPINFRDTDWFRSIQKELTPAEALRIYRKNRGLSQEELAVRLGPGVRKQHISNMEHGLRGISKKMAKRLATIFSTSSERFI